MAKDSSHFILTIKNYRCFYVSKPVRFSLRDGFTALVGPNNSGKSSLFRFFYELRDLFSRLSSNPDMLRIAMREAVPFNRSNMVFDNEEMFCNANSGDLEFELKIDSNNYYSALRPVGKIVFTIPRGNYHFKVQIFPDGIQSVDFNQITFPKPNVISDSVSHIDNDLTEYLALFQAIASVVYIGAFRNAINLGGKTNYFDMTIGQNFISLWDEYKSGLNKKSNKAALRLTEDIKTIFGFRTLEINATHDGTSLQVVINGGVYRLDELGSGLAQFIVVLANIAAKQPSWVLIDEPELNLHSSLQLDLLTTLASYSTRGIVFSTHNIGLARASAEFLYSFRLDAEGRSEVNDFESTQHLSEFLGELSYAGYKNLGFDQVLLVEGPSEIKTIQQFLRRYHKEHKILLLPLGGGSLINSDSEAELQEIKRISTKIHALIDSERDAPEAALNSVRKQFVDLCKKVGINCHVLKRRAMENYFSDHAIQQVKGNKYKSLQPFQDLKNVDPGWSKRENWRIAREMTREELDKTDLGEFLHSL